MRWSVIALLFVAVACTTTTSYTRTGSGIFAPKSTSDDADDENVPRGLTLSADSIAPDGTVILTLRNDSGDRSRSAARPINPTSYSNPSPARHNRAIRFRARAARCRKSRPAIGFN